MAKRATKRRPRSRFDDGLAVRRSVLGARYVDESMRAADDFTLPLQELVTEYCWGAVWTRPGLPRKTRSLLNLAMLTALNRPHEVRLHVRGALRNGCSRGCSPTRHAVARSTSGGSARARRRSPRCSPTPRTASPAARSARRPRRRSGAGCARSSR